MPRRNNSSDGGFDEQDVQNLISTFQRLNPTARAAVLVAVVVIGLFVAYAYYKQSKNPQTHVPNYPTAPDAVSSGDVNLLLGNPSAAGTSDHDNYLMLKSYYSLSYNDSLGTPNWVSWRVTSADLGSAPRKQVFDSDSTLPPGFKVVTHQDYSGGGFDRGHMCPHSDRAANTEMSYATFVMTNIIPQAPHVNQKAWAQLEMYSRDLAKEGNHLFILSGPIGRGGVGSKGPADSVGHGKVTVPAECWKVIVVAPNGPDDPSRISADARVITVDMPNDNTKVGEEWAGFRTSPANIEQKTGLHFFTNLRPDVAAALRRKVDNVPIAPPRPMTHQE